MVLKANGSHHPGQAQILDNVLYQVRDLHVQFSAKPEYSNHQGKRFLSLNTGQSGAAYLTRAVHPRGGHP